MVLEYLSPAVTFSAESATPNTAVANQGFLLSASASTTAATTISTVTATCAALGLSSAPLNSTAGGNPWTLNVTVPYNVFPGSYTILITATDGLGNVNGTSVGVTVNAATGTTETWSGAAETASSNPDWSAGNNWAATYGPGDGDTVYFDNGSGNGVSTMDQSYSLAGLYFNSGTVSYDIVNAGGATLTLTGGVTNNSANLQTLNVPVVLSGTVPVNSGVGGVSLPNSISGTGALSATGGTLTLGTGNSYAGPTTITAGAVSISADSSVGAAPSSPTTNIVLNGGDLLASAGLSLNANRTIGIGATSSANTATTTALIDSATGAFILGGPIVSAGNTGVNNLTINSQTGSTGTVVLGSANTFSGATLIDNGTLQLNNGNALQYSSLNYTTGTLTFGGSVTAATFGGLIGTSASQNLALGAVNLTVQPATADVYNGQISGTGGLTVNSNTLTLGTANYTGSTSLINGANLTISAGTFGAASSSITVGGDVGPGTGGQSTLTIGAGVTSVTAGTVNVGTSGGETGSGLTVNGGTVNFTTTTLGGNPANENGGNSAGAFNVTGGTVNLGATYFGRSGVVTLSGGAVTCTLLNLSANASAHNVIATLSAGTLTVGTTASGGFVIGSQSGSGNNTLDVTGGTLTYAGTDGLQMGSDSYVTISGGTANLSGITVNSATGGNATSQLAWTGGTTYLGSAGLVLGTTGGADTLSPAISLGGTATLGASAAWSSAAPITLGSGQVLIQTANASGTPFNIGLSGILSSTGGVNVTGGGTLTLSGVNTYTGGTSNSPTSTLLIGGAGQLGGGTYAANITNNGILTYASSAIETLSGVISGTGSLNQNGPAALTLTGANTYTGATTISAGTLSLGVGGSIASSSVSLAGGATFDVSAVSTAAAPYNMGGTSFAASGDA